MADPDPSSVERGAILGVSHLILIEKLGAGGMAVVWKAWDTIAQRMVAVKILHESLSSNPDDVRQFRDEHQLLEEVCCPGVVNVFDFDFANGRWYMTMEYIDGYTFADLLSRNGPVCEEDCLLICESVAKTLDYIWNDHGIVHCDIKPENIMINTDGVVKLADMGISFRYHVAAAEPESDEGPVVVNGSPAYMSPEQVTGEPLLDCRADIYSLGATLYHLATGKLLFPALNSDSVLNAHCSVTEQAPDPRNYSPRLSTGFVQLLEYMLVKDREWRYQTWDDVYDDAKEVEAGGLIAPLPPEAISSVHLDE